MRDQFEEQFGSGLGEGKAQLTDDQKIDPGHLFLKAEKPLFVPGLDHLINQRRGSGETDLGSILTGREAQSQSQVGLAGPGVTYGQDILSSFDELTPDQSSV